MNIDDVVDEVNEKHMQPWGEVCQCDGVLNTPLTPYIEKVNVTFCLCYVFSTVLKCLMGYVPVLRPASWAGPMHDLRSGTS